MRERNTAIHGVSLLCNLKYKLSLEQPKDNNKIHISTHSQTHAIHQYNAYFTSRVSLYFKFTTIPTTLRLFDRQNTTG